MEQIKQQMGSIDFSGAMLTKPLKLDVLSKKPLNLESHLNKISFRERKSDIGVANAAATPPTPRHHRPVSMLRSARRGRRTLLHIDKLIQNEIGKQHLGVGIAKKKYCGRKQT